MKKLLFTICLILLFSACSQTCPECNCNNAETNQDNQNEICYKYKKEIQDEIDKLTDKIISEGYYKKNEIRIELDLLFYSPKTKSCLYVISESAGSVFDQENLYWSRRLKDVYTNEVLYDYSTFDPNIAKDDYKIFQEVLEEYKN